MKRSVTSVVSLAAVVFALFSVGFSVQAAQNPQVKLQVEAGYDGYYRSDRWLPLLVRVTNTGPDISGELRVTSQGTPGLNGGSYLTNVEFPNGSSKQIFLYTTLGPNAYQVKVELANSSGIIAEDTQNLRWAAPQDLLFAVITESPRSTVDLQNIHTGPGDTHQVNWQIPNLPDTPAALEALDALVFADVDTGKLSTSQRNAISDWVIQGGHLIVTGGPNWQKTQAGFTDLLPLKPTSSTTLVSLPSIANYAGQSGQKLEVSQGSPIVVAQGTPTSDARVLAADGGVTLLARRSVGEGLVDYLAADPGIEPFQSWKERSRFWLTLLTSVGQQPSWSHGLIDAGVAEQVANLIKGIRLPDVFQLCGFLAIYIIVIGPLNYLILKRLGRRELAWFTIPLIILACSVVAYVTGFSLRGTQATINRIGLVQVWPGTDRAQVSGVVGVLAPRRSTYTITMGNGMTLSALDSASSGSPTDFGGPTIVQYPNYEARNVPVDAGLTAAFATSGFIQSPTLEGQAQIELQAPTTQNRRTGLTAPHVTGSVKNTTGLVLENAVVLALGGSMDVGTLNPGDSAEFDINMAPTNYLTPPLSLGNYQRGNYTVSNSGYAGSYRNPQDTTIQDIMGSRYANYYNYAGSYSLGYGDNPQQQENRRRQAFLRSILADTDPSGGRGDGVYLVGWTTTSPIDVTLRDAAFQIEDTTLYIFRLPVTIKAAADEVEIPFPLFTWIPTDDSTQRVQTPYSLNLQTGEKAVFRYSPLPAIHLQNVTRLNIAVQATVFSQATISLWDWGAGQWVDFSINGPQTAIDDPARFIGPENTVELQVQPAAGVRLMSYDRIDVAMYGRLAGM